MNVIRDVSRNLSKEEHAIVLRGYGSFLLPYFDDSALLLRCVCRPYPFSLVHPLCTLACCSTLTSLHISTPGAKCTEEDIGLLCRLRGLRGLTLAFQGDYHNGSSVCIAPLSQLTNLQSLVVQGVVPSAAQVPAAAGAAAGEGGGGSSGKHGSNSCLLPISLTSLQIQGKGWDDRGEVTTTVKGWLDHIPSGNQLKELKVRNFSIDACSSLFDGVDLGRLSVLKELHVLTERALAEIDACGWVQLPLCLTSLSDLEVLEVCSSTPELPGQQCYFDLVPGQFGLLNQLPKLRKLGWVINVQQLEVPPEAQLSQLEELRFYGELSAWLTASICPQMKRIMVEGWAFSGVLQGLAAFTQLTTLRLDGGVAYAMSQLEGWGDMRVLGHGVQQLRRLELVNYVAAEPEDDEQLPGLAVPDLSAFIQIKQLQLVCLMDPENPVPDEPSSSDFLQSLSKLTQLEQLQLEGYSTFTPAMVCCLAQSLPQLQLLEVGLCKHPELEKELIAGKNAISWEELHPGFKEVQQLCKLVKAKLQVKVGCALQWL